MDSHDNMWVVGGGVTRGKEPAKTEVLVLKADASGTSTWEYRGNLSFSPALEAHSAVMDRTDPQGSMWIFGGLAFSAEAGFFHSGGVWHHRMDVTASPPWNHIEGGPVLFSHSAVMDSLNRMWVFGGAASMSELPSNRLHFFDVQSRKWTLDVGYSASDPDKLSRACHTAVMDRKDCMWVFGGMVGFTVLSDDLNRLCVTNLSAIDLEMSFPEWIKLGAENGPSPRSMHTAVLDCEDRMWIYGGAIRGADDLYFFSIDHTTNSGKWTPLKLTKAPEPRLKHSAVMDSKSNMWIYGGSTFTLHGNKFGVHEPSADVFVLSTGSRCAVAPTDAAPTKPEAGPVPAGPSTSSSTEPEWTTTAAAGETEHEHEHPFTSYVKSIGGVMCAGALLGFFFYRRLRQARQSVVQAPRASQQYEMAVIESGQTSSPRLAMFSARFDGGEVEKKIRQVSQILNSRGCEVLIVQAGVGEDFGKMTMSCLHRIREEKGVMIAVCTHHYGEKTASTYSSHRELTYAQDYGVEVLPLQFADQYPPNPPSGPGHPYDRKGEAQALLGMVLRPCIVKIDCRSKTAEEIADEVEPRLRSKRRNTDFVHGGRG